ncbi:UNVERIFIED_CONTAM: 6-phosphogluconate dehydrogenase, decarboxylating 2 [Sesamum calycinum]|uniref:Hexosyltransferase n=1 Tax=Sesamum calycinum TaxID=2727403 RepID=A0AAW2MMA9_9LAMI
MYDQNEDHTLWKLGTLPAGLATFYSTTKSLDKVWHVLGLGINPSISMEEIDKAAVIHFSGDMKPWLDIALNGYKWESILTMRILSSDLCCHNLSLSQPIYGPNVLRLSESRHDQYATNLTFGISLAKLSSPERKNQEDKTKVEILKLVDPQVGVLTLNKSLNIAEKGFPISVYNRTTSKVDETIERAKAEGNLPVFGFHDPESFVQSIQKPRVIIMLVKAGAPVDQTIKTLSAYMEKGDCIIDGGNEWYENTERREEKL